MTLTVSHKDYLDKPIWRSMAIPSKGLTVGAAFAYDQRKCACRSPFTYIISATTTFDIYNQLLDCWRTTPAFTAVGGSIAAGACAMFVPSHGPNGTISAGATTTTFAISALLNSASAQVNQLANNGSGIGYYVRVIGNAAGSSGKTEIVQIVGNSAGTTPTLTVSPALTFTPANGDRYEILSGRVYLLGAGTTAAGYWKAFDVATETISGNLATTNLAATIGTETCFVALDEQYVPHDRENGDGFLKGSGTYNNGILYALVATGSGATSITGQAANGDASVLLNEYSRFQIRIVEDTAIPTAVGQRRKITSHTAGPSPVYTVPAWTVTPSANAKFVIEQNNDLLVWTGGNTVTYSYAAGGYATDANWSTAAAAGGATQVANPPAAPGAGNVAESCYSLQLDSSKNCRHGHIVWFRGANTAALYHLDYAANTWSSAYTLNLSGANLSTGTCSAHDPAGNHGRYMYINVNATQNNFRYDLLARRIEPFAMLPIAQGAAVVCPRFWVEIHKDGTSYLSNLGLGLCTSTSNNCWSVTLTR